MSRHSPALVTRTLQAERPLLKTLERIWYCTWPDANSNICFMEIESLKAIPFLKNLSDGELNSFSALLETRECKQGERILEEDAVPTAFHIVCDGVVHVRRRGANRREMLLARLGSGSFFGEINLFDPGVATASIYAMKKTNVATISYSRFRAFMDENPRAGYQIASAILTEVARRMRTTDERLANSIFRSDQPGGGKSG